MGLFCIVMCVCMTCVDVDQKKIRKTAVWGGEADVVFCVVWFGFGFLDDAGRCNPVPTLWIPHTLQEED